MTALPPDAFVPVPLRWPQLAWCRACEVGTLERRCWNCGAALDLPLWLDGLSLVSARRAAS